MTGMVLTTSGSSALSTPSRTSSRKLGSTTERWSTVGPPSDNVYGVPCSASPSTVSRTKYGLAESGPSWVTVHDRSFARHESAVLRYVAASALAPLASAIVAAVTRPAIWAAIDEGE